MFGEEMTDRDDGGNGGSSDISVPEKAVAPPRDEGHGGTDAECLAAHAHRRALERRLAVIARVLPILRSLKAKAAGKEVGRK